jgi:VanZ family protein
MLLLTLTHLPRLGPIPELPGKDKTLHFVAYFLAAVFCQTAFASSTHPRRKLFFIIAALLTMGALDEITQPYVNRTCDLHDWFADAGGILVGSALYYLKSFYYRRARTK